VRAAVVLILVSRVAFADDAPLAPAAVVDAVGRAIATRDAGAPKGAGNKLAAVAKTTAAERTAIRDALAKAHRLIDNRAVGDALVLTVEGKSGARARIALGNDGGEIVVIANPSTVKPPGACVAVPQSKHPLYVHGSAINQDGELHESTTFWGFQTERIFDVDGDGVLDAFVPVAQQFDCPEDIQWRVFVIRGSCGHDVGIVGKGAIAPDDPSTPDVAGYRVLVVKSESTRNGKGPIPEMTNTATTFAFSPKLGRYDQMRVESHSGVCHHCARWHCTPATP
jgi:hypothetical protein